MLRTREVKNIKLGCTDCAPERRKSLYLGSHLRVSFQQNFEKVNLSLSGDYFLIQDLASLGQLVGANPLLSAPLAQTRDNERTASSCMETTWLLKLPANEERLRTLHH